MYRWGYGGADIDVEGDVIRNADQELLQGILWPLVDALPGKQGTVLRARFQEGKTLKETGENVGVTIERARVIQSEALRELRKPNRARELQPFLQDTVIYSQAIQGGGVAQFNATWTSSTERAALRL